MNIPIPIYYTFIYLCVCVCVYICIYLSLLPVLPSSMHLARICLSEVWPANVKVKNGFFATGLSSVGFWMLG